MAKNPRTFTDKIRQAVLDSEFSRYRISKEIGISESVLSRFVNRKGGMTLDSLDKLAEFLGLDISVPKGKR